MSERIDRSKFINRTPGTAVNRKVDAPSTLTCTNDSWGTHPEHYRYVNIRDESGKLIMRDDDSGKPKKELRLIGQGHVTWDDHYVQVRLDENHFQWFKHFPVALELAVLGKLDKSQEEWVKAEGQEQFQKGMLPIFNGSNRPTKIILGLVKLGVLAKEGDKFVLASDAKEAVQAVVDAVKIEAIAEVKAEQVAVTA
jgi:hypothetical protein